MFITAHTSLPSSAALNLQRVVVYRSLMLVAQLAAVAAAQAMDFSLPLEPLSTVIAGYVVLNGVTWVRLRWINLAVGERELFFHLLTDVVILGALFYFTGGSTNPLVSLFLLPLSLAAASLPGRYTWAVAGAALMCYTLLMRWYMPLPNHQSFNVHVIGMWFGFLLSAVIIAYFAVKMSGTLREREQALAQAREDALRDERLVALGTLAAGAAHELGTPLATMAVLAKDLEHECAAVPAVAGPLSVLRTQISRCKEILAKLAASAGQNRAEAGREDALDLYLAQIMAQWHSERPAVRLRQQWEGPRPAPHIIADQTLTHAITNILNNAADASEREVEVIGRWSERELDLEIRDRGAGLDDCAVNHVGEPFFTTKAPGQGLGLGLFLAQSAIKRLGGRLQISNRAEGGACARIMLPLSGLLLRP